MENRRMNREEAIIIIAKNQIKNLTKDERDDFLSDWWVIEEFDLDLQNLPESLKKEVPNDIKEEIKKNTKYDDPDNIKYNPIIILGIYYEFRGVKNQYLANEIFKITKEKVTIEGDVEVLEKCPCCDYFTLDEKCDWDICKVCFWEDDCTTELDKISDPNSITLREGKKNFLRIGASKKRSMEFVDKEGKLKYKK